MQYALCAAIERDASEARDDWLEGEGKASRLLQLLLTGTVMCRTGMQYAEVYTQIIGIRSDPIIESARLGSDPIESKRSAQLKSLTTLLLLLLLCRRCCSTRSMSQGPQLTFRNVYSSVQHVQYILGTQQ